MFYHALYIHLWITVVIKLKVLIYICNLIIEIIIEMKIYNLIVAISLKINIPIGWRLQRSETKHFLFAFKLPTLDQWTWKLVNNLLTIYASGD